MTKQGIIQVLLILAAATLFFYLGHRTPGAILVCVAGCFLVLSLFAPSAHNTVLELASRAAKLVAHALGLVMLTGIYYTIFLFGAYWLRLNRIDSLNRQFPCAGRTNWVCRVNHDPNGKEYAKQFSLPHGGSGAKAANP